MILELAQQSIQAKLRLKSTTMLGNYEFYYAVGIICKELNIEVDAGQKPKELYQFIMGKIDGQTSVNEKVSHLAEMLKYYAPEENYDEQMQELLQKGREGY